MATQGLDSFAELLDKAAAALKLQHQRELEENAEVLSMRYEEELRVLQARLQLRSPEVKFDNHLQNLQERDLQAQWWNRMQSSIISWDDELSIAPAKCFEESALHTAMNGNSDVEEPQDALVEDLEASQQHAPTDNQGVLRELAERNEKSQSKEDTTASATMSACASTPSSESSATLGLRPLPALKRSRTADQLSAIGNGVPKRTSIMSHMSLEESRRTSHFDLTSTDKRLSKLADLHEHGNGNGLDSAFSSGELHPEILSSLSSGADSRAMRPRFSETNNVIEIGSPSGRRRVTWQGDDVDISKERFGVSSPETVEEAGEEEDEDEEEEQIEMLPTWRIRRRKSTVSNLARGMSGTNFKQLLHSPTREFEATGNYQLSDALHTSFPVRLMSKVVARPSSGKRLIWDIIGVLLIGYDLIWIPMQAFNPANTTGTTILAWTSTIFWTLDIPASFLVGYHNEGVLEMRVAKIARHYCRTWLSFDITVIVIDWTLTALAVMTDDSEKGAGGVGYMRLGKAVRFLRLLRLLRLLKASGVLKEMLERIQSEAILILVGIGKLLFLIMMINHLFACSWYAIGNIYSDDAHTSSWIEAYDIESRTLIYRYATSLHWSLTQFTPASMEVYPENEVERCFAVSVIISAMVAFSSFVSAITNAMTQLRNLNSEKNSQFSTLRKYFAENRVSVAVMGRIYGYLQQAMSKSKTRVHESDVMILQLLPWSLKSELLEEVYSPTLHAHPFFYQFSACYQTLLRKLFQCAIEEISKPIGQELFISGEVASKMYFVLSGYLEYTRDKSTEEGTISAKGSQVLSASQWCSEPALWIKWKHLGNLLATSNCELIALKSEKVGEVLTQLKEDEDSVKRYVKIFVRYFKKFPEYLHDAWTDLELIQDMTNKAFAGDDGDDEEHHGRLRNSNRRLSNASRRPSMFANLSTRVSGSFNNSGRPSALDFDLESDIDESDEEDDSDDSLNSDGSTHSVKSKISTVSKKSTVSTKSNKSKKAAKAKEEARRESETEDEGIRSGASSRRSSSKSDHGRSSSKGEYDMQKSDSDKRRVSNESAISKKSRAEQSRSSLLSAEDNTEIDQWLEDAEKRRSRKIDRKSTTNSQSNKVSRFFGAVPFFGGASTRSSCSASPGKLAKKENGTHSAAGQAWS